MAGSCGVALSMHSLKGLSTLTLTLTLTLPTPSQILYTQPVTPRAGEEVTVFYNPDITVLRGRPETYLRGSWNRHVPKLSLAGWLAG